MAIETEKKSLPPRWVIRAIWRAHRFGYQATGGRWGLRRPIDGRRVGLLWLPTIGRRSGVERTAILCYLDDGPNLVMLAMNGWDAREPAWWLNLQARPDATVTVVDGERRVHARTALGDERDRLWSRLREHAGYGDDLDAMAKLRAGVETTVIVLEPRG